MQISVDEGTTSLLKQQAAAHGCSVDEYAASLLAKLAKASAHPLTLPADFHIDTHEGALVWMLSRNPGPLPEHAPDTNWRAIKAEGWPF